MRVRACAGVVAAGDGRVVLADAAFHKDRTESMAFAVRVRDGKARVVAMFD